MYDDARARGQAEAVRGAFAEHEKRMGYAFNASFALPKILWFKEELPRVYEKAAFFLHQADYMVGRLCGFFGVTDYSNALKAGYDLLSMEWPDGLISGIGLSAGKLPKVLPPGEAFASVSGEAARALGLSERTAVAVGSTDGYSSALAAGTVREGDWASVVGSTLVLKGVTGRLLTDPNGSAYSHRLPTGDWMLGGASNVGGAILNGFAAGGFRAMDEAAGKAIPTGVRCYPLTGRGERFPFVDGKAEGFYFGDISGGRLYPAIMEGIGFVERLSYERMAAMGARVGDVVSSAGGACKSDVWLRIRASILNKAIKVPLHIDAAMGSAILSAMAHFGGLGEAADSMVRVRKTVEPDGALVGGYGELYGRFREDCRKAYGI